MTRSYQHVTPDQDDPRPVVRSVCWCESTFVYVTARDVLNGRTLSCGATFCVPQVPVDRSVQAM